MKNSDRFFCRIGRQFGFCYEEGMTINKIYYDFDNEPIKNFHHKVRHSKYDIRNFVVKYFEGDCL